MRIEDKDQTFDERIDKNRLLYFAVTALLLAGFLAGACTTSSSIDNQDVKKLEHKPAKTPKDIVEENPNPEEIKKNYNDNIRSLKENINLLVESQNGTVSLEDLAEAYAEATTATLRLEGIIEQNPQIENGAGTLRLIADSWALAAADGSISLGHSKYALQMLVRLYPNDSDAELAKKQIEIITDEAIP